MAKKADEPEPLSVEKSWVVMADESEAQECEEDQSIKVSSLKSAKKKKRKRGIKEKAAEGEQPSEFQVSSPSQSSISAGIKRRIVLERIVLINQNDLEKDRSTIFYDSESNQLLYFLPILPLLKSIALQDQSFISWSYSKYQNLNLVAQNFPRVLSYTTMLICNEHFYPEYRSYQTICISNLKLSSTVPSFFVFDKDVVESISMNVEQPDTLICFVEDFPISFVSKDIHSSSQNSHTDVSQDVDQEFKANSIALYEAMNEILSGSELSE